METTKKVTANEIRQRFQRIDALAAELSASKLIIMDKEYNLSEWKTISDYAKKYHYSMARVQMWISREVIPSDCVIVVPELNYLKLIKDRPYDTRATQ